MTMEHEWIEEIYDGGYIGYFTNIICKNCGALIIDLRYTLSLNKKPKHIVIPGTRVYLTDDCEQSLKMMQTYWEKNYMLSVPLLYQTDKKKKKTLYKKKK